MRQQKHQKKSLSQRLRIAYKVILYSWLSLNFSNSIKAQDVIIVASPFVQYSYYNEAGEVEGIFVKEVQDFMSGTGLSFEIRLLPWTRALRVSEQRDNVLIYSIIRNEKRENTYHWLRKLGDVTDILITRNKAPWNQMSLKDFIKQDALAICELNSAQCDMLHQLGFRRDNILHLSTANEKTLTNMIVRERADIVFSTKTDLTILNQQQPLFHMVDEFTTSEFYLAARKNIRSDLLSKIQTASKNKED